MNATQPTMPGPDPLRPGPGGWLFDPSPAGPLCPTEETREPDRAIYPRRVISGGQTGVDQIGLCAAWVVGIATGGWMPKGYRTLTGPRPDLAAWMGLQEHPSPNYPPRTRRNILESNATLRFAHNWNSPGERCTQRILHEVGQPYQDINVPLNPKLSPNPKPDLTPTVTVSEVAAWIRRHSVETLNIAGNPIPADGGLLWEPWGERVFDYLLQVFLELGHWVCPARLDLGKRRATTKSAWHAP